MNSEWGLLLLLGRGDVLFQIFIVDFVDLTLLDLSLNLFEIYWLLTSGMI